MRVFDATGVHIEHGRSLVLLGAEGAQTIRAVMRSLRAEPMQFIGSEPVTGRQDFLVDGIAGPLTEGEKSSRDVLELSSEHYRVVVRPSGTEAKLKYYFDYRRAAGAAGLQLASRQEELEAVGVGPTARPSTPTWPAGPVSSCRRGT